MMLLAFQHSAFNILFALNYELHKKTFINRMIFTDCY